MDKNAHVSNEEIGDLVNEWLELAANLGAFAAVMQATNQQLDQWKKSLPFNIQPSGEGGRPDRADAPNS